MSEKVTAYDLSYLHSNPFKNITAEILLNNIDKILDDNNDEENDLGLTEYLDSLENSIHLRNTSKNKTKNPDSDILDASSVNVDVNVNANNDTIIDNLIQDIENANDNSNPSFFAGFTSYIKSYFTTPAIDNASKEIQKLYERQANALTYDEWYDVSLKLDVLENNNLWKEIRESDLYDYKLIENQLLELRECRESKNFQKMLYIIRTCWKRDFGGINNEKLYINCHVGTKNLITDYISECVNCLSSLVSEDCTLDDEYILNVLLESKRNYGRAAITMSGGGAFGLIGIGVFSTLLEMDLFPKIVSGSSCGSIVSAVMCSKTSDEIKVILSNLFNKTFEVFNIENDYDTFYNHLSRFLKFGVWFDSKYLQLTVKDFLGNITFREAFNKTGRILNITVSSATVHDQPTLLNYLTAPNVLIWSAVCASCSLPLVFAPSTIYEKNLETGELIKWSNPSLKFVDGSLNSDLPISRLSEMFNVNHTIACQVNPHISPLVKFSSDCKESLSNWDLKKIIFNTSSIFSLELSHYCELLNEMGIFSNLATKIKQLISQSYTGDITILPELKFGEQSKTLVNPSPKFIWNCILKGARATWPQVSMIKDQYTVEFSMDKYISVLKSRVVFDSSKNENNSNLGSTSCHTSPKKYHHLSPLKIPKSANVYDYSRRRSDTITVSEDYKNDETPFGQIVAPKTSPRRSNKSRSGVKKSMRSYRHKEFQQLPQLKPDHSFESLRYIQRIQTQSSNISHKYSRSFSYTQLLNERPTFNKGKLSEQNAENSEDELILITNKDGTRRLSTSSSILNEPEEQQNYQTIKSLSFNSSNKMANDDEINIYPSKINLLKDKRE